MATVFARLRFIQQAYRKNRYPNLTQDQKITLGKIICQEYIQQKEINDTIQKIDSREPEGNFKVLSYPKKFSPVIDQHILAYYKSIISPPPKRKRIAPNSPVYSSNYKR